MSKRLKNTDALKFIFAGNSTFTLLNSETENRFTYRVKKAKDLKMIKNDALPKDEALLLREKFINEYSKKKGWNPNELSTNQMLEIVSQREYKTPGIILG